MSYASDLLQRDLLEFMRASTGSIRLFVGNLAPSTTAADVKSLFEAGHYGPIREVLLISASSAIVVYYLQSSADRAIAGLDGRVRVREMIDRT